MLLSVQPLCSVAYLFRKLLLLFTAGSQAITPCTAFIKFSVGTPYKQFTAYKCVFTCAKVLKEYCGFINIREDSKCPFKLFRSFIQKRYKEMSG